MKVNTNYFLETTLHTFSLKDFVWSDDLGKLWFRKNVDFLGQLSADLK